MGGGFFQEKASSVNLFGQFGPYTGEYNIDNLPSAGIKTTTRLPKLPLVARLYHILIYFTV